MTKTVLHIPTVRRSYCTYAQTYKHYPLTVISTRGQEDDELSKTLYMKAGHLEMKKKRYTVTSATEWISSTIHLPAESSKIFISQSAGPCLYAYRGHTLIPFSCHPNGRWFKYSDMIKRGSAAVHVQLTADDTASCELTNVAINPNGDRT